MDLKVSLKLTEKNTSYHLTRILFMKRSISVLLQIFRSSRSEVFLRKVILKICNKLTGEQPCRNAISIKLQSNFIKITLRHGFSPVNLLHIFRTPFTKNTCAWLFLKYPTCVIPLQKYHPFFWKQLWLMCSKYGLWFLDVFVTSISVMMKHLSDNWSPQQESLLYSHFFGAVISKFMIFWSSLRSHRSKLRLLPPSHPLSNHISPHTAWKVSKYGVFPGPYFPAFGLNT